LSTAAERRPKQFVWERATRPFMLAKVAGNRRRKLCQVE
jgi:hypothetical protein